MYLCGFCLNSIGQIQLGVSRFKPTEATKIIYDKIYGNNVKLHKLFLVSQYCMELTSDFLKLNDKNSPLVLIVHCIMVRGSFSLRFMPCPLSPLYASLNFSWFSHF